MDVAQGTGVTVQGHVAVGQIMAHDVEAHGHVGRRRDDGIALLLTVLDLEVVDDGMGHGVAAGIQVALDHGERLFLLIDG